LRPLSYGGHELDIDESLGAAVEAVRRGEELRLSGLRISAKAMTEIREAAPKVEGKTQFPAVHFSDVIFEGGVHFSSARFTGEASFARCTFEGAALFQWASFEGGADFTGSAFTFWAAFGFSSFRGSIVHFAGARFDFEAAFHDTVFEDWAWFKHARFERQANFNRARFVDGDFREAVFDGDALFAGATCTGSATFADATFHSDMHGILRAAEDISFEGTTFVRPVEVAIGAERLSLARAWFPEGGQLTIHGPTEVVLDHARFGRPFVLTGAKSQDLDSHGQARLVSMRWADVRNLVLADVDLRGCRFVKAHNLNGLRLEGDICIESAPDTRLVRLSRLWTRRQVLAEEHQWRRYRPGWRGRRTGWYPQSCRPPQWLVSRHMPRTLGIQYVGRSELDKPLPASYVANIYRDLRKGREAVGDEPGAADFFYGEMEMRRFDHERPWSERAALFLYWLVSGYALRATRALAALAVTVVGFALLLWWIGFDPRPGFARSLLFSAESTSNLFRTPRTPNFQLTAWGEAMQIPLRLLGPLFFGLALLSVRGRVKR
jgi:uncharacterized protein YjbI with pentapeptide repeats